MELTTNTLKTNLDSPALEAIARYAEARRGKLHTQQLREIDGHVVLIDQMALDSYKDEQGNRIRPRLYRMVGDTYPIAARLEEAGWTISDDGQAYEYTVYSMDDAPLSDAAVLSPFMNEKTWAMYKVFSDATEDGRAVVSWWHDRFLDIETYFGEDAITKDSPYRDARSFMYMNLLKDEDIEKAKWLESWVGRDHNI